MTAADVDVVTVALDDPTLGGPVDIGTLRRNRVSQGSIAAFAYNPDWLASGTAFAIDPVHTLVPGDQWPRNGAIDRIFSDAAPDRWGRTLMARQEAHLARTGQRRARVLDDWDYLLGVSDPGRMGALRLRGPDGAYLRGEGGIPPTTSLPDLAAAAREIERSNRPTSRLAQELALLLAPGSSLGGARPKATFLESDGSPWMAKFPSATDARDMAACEYVLNELAAAAGIGVPEHRLLDLGGGHRTFAARRFDRHGGGRRMYASAMTLLSSRDHEAASYLDIALAIADFGDPRRIDAELEQLFRRVAFNVLAGHRDDHLRNHGFLRAPGGWLLAPAFDLNPMPEMAAHALSIDDADRTGDIGLLLDTAEFYRLRRTNAERIVGEVRGVLDGWRAIARAARLGVLETDALEAVIDVSP